MPAGFIKPFLTAATLLLAVGQALNAQDAKTDPKVATAPAPKDATKAPKKPTKITKPAALPPFNPMLGDTELPTPPIKPNARPPKKSKTPKKLAYEDRTNLNSASKEELMKLNGVTDVYAAKIIAGRPYTSKAALVVNGVIPSTVYFLIKDYVTAGKVAKKP